MNGKKAKALWSMAQDCAPMQPKNIKQRKQGGGPITTHPQTQRAVYLSLKAKYKEARR